MKKSITITFNEPFEELGFEANEVEGSFKFIANECGLNTASVIANTDSVEITVDNGDEALAEFFKFLGLMDEVQIVVATQALPRGLEP